MAEDWTRNPPRCYDPPAGMLPGYNHNLRHRDRVFHVQTEDGGRRDPRVVTQLFLAGELLAIERWGYGELLEGGLDPKELAETVRVRMMAQHKAMLRSVARGAFDARLSPTYPASEAPTLEVPIEALAEAGPASDDDLLDAIRSELERQEEADDRAPTVEMPAPGANDERNTTVETPVPDRSQRRPKSESRAKRRMFWK